MKFDWTISIGTVIQVLSCVILLVTAWVKLASRLGSIEAEQLEAKQERRDILKQLRDLTIGVARLEGPTSGGISRRNKPHE